MLNLKTEPNYNRTIFKDPFSGFSHLGGALLSIIGLVILLKNALECATTMHIITFSIFGATLILLYTASAVYHLLNVSDSTTLLLRRIDHMMIYLLIAGTYTPICMIALQGAWRWSLLISIWTLALAGIIITIIWFSAPRWFTTILYVLMGWLVIIAIWPLMQTIPLGGILYLVGGGVLYTIGAVIYGTKWPPITYSWFGFHEIFHVFVLAGSFAHYWVMYKYIMLLG